MSKLIPGRSAEQCYDPWRYAFNPTSRKIRKQRPRKAIAGSTVGDSTMTAKRDRAVTGRASSPEEDVIDDDDLHIRKQPSNKHTRGLDRSQGAWTPDEDRRFRELHNQKGDAWSATTECIPGRYAEDADISGAVYYAEYMKIHGPRPKIAIYFVCTSTPATQPTSVFTSPGTPTINTETACRC